MNLNRVGKRPYSLAKNMVMASPQSPATTTTNTTTKTPGANDLLLLLQKEGILSPDKAEDLKKQAEITTTTIDEILIKEKIVDEEKLARTKAELYNITFVDLMSETIDPMVLNIVPKSAAEHYRMIAFRKVGEELNVALLDPGNFPAIAAISFLAEEEHLKPHIFITSPASFKSAFQHYEALRREVAEVIEGAKDRFTPETSKSEEDKKPIEEIVKNAPVSRIVAMIMKQAVDTHASDIHLEPMGKESRVRYRIDGVLRTSITLPGYLHPSIVARIKVLSNLKLDETRIPQDGRITEEVTGKIIDFRVSTLPLLEGTEKVVMRVLDTSVGVPTLDELGFRKEYLTIIDRNYRQPHGLFLISGPTGSGKSTTLYTILNMMNKEGVNILTLEDPIEYYIKGINQSQIRPEVGYTFASGLRALLRQDPNVIMVGEIRDRETAELAVHAALTGHLIFSTIHTNDSFGVIPRLVDMAVEPFLIGATLNVAIAQRLARRICDACKITTEIPTGLIADITKEWEGIPARYRTGIKGGASGFTFYKGKGCPRCNNEGYKGRLAVAEILQVTDNVRRVIVAGGNLVTLAEEAKKQEMITLRQDALLKVVEGLTTVEELMRLSQEQT